MFNIILNTPTWVFFLFIFLVILGLTQIKDRNLSFKRAMLLPYIMLILSFTGLLSSFGLVFYSIIIWIIGVCLGVGLNTLLKLPRDSFFIENENMFFIKGSFIPLFLIMAIFFTKYIVGVISAKELDILGQTWFVFLISSLYGFFSGMFFGRIFVLKALKKETRKRGG